MTKAVLAVYANAASPDQEGEFNTWYVGTHIPEVLALDGFVGARRFRLSEAQLGGGSDHQYVTMYDIDAPDVGAVLKGLTDGFKNGSVTFSATMSPGPVVVWDEQTAR
jgi:hypothetical protein